VFKTLEEVWFLACSFERFSDPCSLSWELSGARSCAKAGDTRFGVWISGVLVFGGGLLDVVTMFSEWCGKVVVAIAGRSVL
jgi:hypothetical protein